MLYPVLIVFVFVLCIVFYKSYTISSLSIYNCEKIQAFRWLTVLTPLRNMLLLVLLERIFVLFSGLLAHSVLCVLLCAR